MCFSHSGFGGGLSVGLIRSLVHVSVILSLYELSIPYLLCCKPPTQYPMRICIADSASLGKGEFGTVHDVLYVTNLERILLSIPVLI